MTTTTQDKAELKMKVRRALTAAEGDTGMLVMFCMLAGMTELPGEKDPAQKAQMFLKVDAANDAFKQAFKLCWDLLGEPH